MDSIIVLTQGLGVMVMMTWNVIVPPSHHRMMAAAALLCNNTVLTVQDEVIKYTLRKQVNFWMISFSIKLKKSQ